MNFQIQHGISLDNYFIQMTFLTTNQDPVGCILLFFLFGKDALLNLKYIWRVLPMEKRSHLEKDETIKIQSQ